jgi:hypothetical protein
MKTILLLLAGFAVFAQAPYTVKYAAFTAVSSQTGVTSDKLTIQQNQNTPVNAQMVRAVIVATVAGTVVIQKGGSAPTATVATIRTTDDAAGFSRLTAYSASNGGAGTAISLSYTLTANVPLVLDMTATALLGPGTTKNVSIVVALGSSGDVQSQMFWKEQTQ